MMKRIIFLLILLQFITSCCLLNTDEYQSWGRASDYYLYKNSHVIYMKYYWRTYWEGDNSYDELLGYVLFDFNYKTSELQYKIFKLPKGDISKPCIYSQNDTIYITGEIKAKGHKVYQEGSKLHITGETVFKVEIYSPDGKYIQVKEAVNELELRTLITGGYVIKITDPDTSVYCIKFMWKRNP